MTSGRSGVVGVSLLVDVQGPECAVLAEDILFEAKSGVRARTFSVRGRARSRYAQCPRCHNPCMPVARESWRFGKMAFCKTCRRSIRRDHFYCSHCWTGLVEGLCSRVDRISRAASEIYIGRTCDPEARREEHFEESRRPRLTVLHWSDDIDEICVLEEARARRWGRWARHTFS